MPTYLMSYPGPTWHIRGGENFRSTERQSTNPRKAMLEWLSLADAITRVGGHILVMPPPPIDPPLTGLIYTANIGQLFGSDENMKFVIASMAVAHRKAEREYVRPFIEEAGLPTANATHTWEGQADLQSVGGNRFIATWGVRSVRDSVADVRPLLPPGSRLLEIQLQEPFFHGDTCINTLLARNGVDSLLLVYPGAFVGATTESVRKFIGDRTEVYPVDRDDALGYACNALCVNGTVLAPTGLSSSLRGHLTRRGFPVEELELKELFGKGGGGPRCLVNELRGLVANPGAPTFASLRAELYERAESYPESYTPPAPSAPPGPTTPPSST